MRSRTAATVATVASGFAAVALATGLTAPGFGAAAAPPVAHPNPAVSNRTIDYAASPRGPNGQPTTLLPLSPAVLKPAIADQEYLAYQTAGDLGGFLPAPVGHLALSSGGHTLVGVTVKGQIPHYARAGNGKINSFAVIGSPAPATTPPDNGRQPVPRLGVPPPTSPATTTAPPPNQGFGGATTTTPTATAAAPPATTTTTRPPGTTTAPTTTTVPTTTAPTTTPPPATTTTTTGTPTPTTPPATTTAVTTTTITTTSVTTTTTATTTTTTNGSSGGSSSGGGTTTPSSHASCGTTGLSITSDHSSCRIYATNMAPGGSASEVMTITNTADMAFALYLRAAGTRNRLWNDLELGVWKTGTAAPSPLPPLLNWTAQDNDLGITLQPGDTVELNVELHLKSTAGNADQNLKAVIDFVWTAKS